MARDYPLFYPTRRGASTPDQWGGGGMGECFVYTDIFPRRDKMIKFSGPSSHPNSFDLRFLILEPADATRRHLVIRSARDNAEPRFSLTLDYEAALTLKEKLNEALAKMVDDRSTKTDVQVRF